MIRRIIIGLASLTLITGTAFAQGTHDYRDDSGSRADQRSDPGVHALGGGMAGAGLGALIGCLVTIPIGCAPGAAVGAAVGGGTGAVVGAATTPPPRGDDNQRRD